MQTFTSASFKTIKKTKRATTMWIKAYMIHDESTEKKLIKWKYNSLKKLNVQQILWTHTKKGDSFISRLLKKNENLFLPLIRPTASKYLFLLLSITHVKKSIKERMCTYTINNEKNVRCYRLAVDTMITSFFPYALLVCHVFLSIGY